MVGVGKDNLTTINERDKKHFVKYSVNKEGTQLDLFGGN